MSRRSRRSNKSYPSLTRQRRGSATRRSLHLPSYRPTVHPVALPHLPFSDRQVKKRLRNYHVRSPSPSSLPRVDITRFYNPSRPRLRPEHFVCARREIRREVIFASGRAGSRVSRPVFNSQSKVKC